MDNDYIKICDIDISKYYALCSKKIKTTEVIITNKQIQHIEEKRKGIYNKYSTKLKDIICNPDYIIEDTKHIDTGLIIKKYNKNVVTVLRLNTSKDGKKNSIITIWEIKEKRLERYLLTHKIIYKKE